ncbi:flagellar export chaperone FliS [Paenibacillus bovis]|uniref:Flagellar secretion chaperone FliS n=1 Tax=Paenibacillus bovis TaxID=1616788 RepID=A0A172ZMX1_9BACL|nr:flagellar export chaperone FliS [Paenibacillus bovis]ANF98480.1 flagellar export chaperone FliS [Paenibacillus bovis]
MISSPYEKYRQNAVQTSPGQLLIMLYDGAIRFTLAAIDGINQKDYEKSNINFGKAQAIVSEFRASLDRSYEVAENLDRLYEYMNYLLIQANVKKDVASAEEALGYLKDLRETWVEANKLAPAALSEAKHG